MLTDVERAGLKEAGFDDEEIVELNGIKDVLEQAETNIEKAITVASLGLLFFIGTKVDIKVNGVQIDENTLGYRIYGTSERGLHSPTAIVIADIENDRPIEIQYGIRVTDDEPAVIKILERDRFDGSVEFFIPTSLTYLKLTAYSFIIEDKDGKEQEIYRRTFMAGQPLKAIVQRPIDGAVGKEDMIVTTPISDEFNISTGGNA